MSRKPAPIIMTPINSEESLDSILAAMKNNGFFGDKESPSINELVSDTRKKILEGASELWFSNGVHEFKIITGSNGVNIYNFTLVYSDAIQAVQAAA